MRSSCPLASALDLFGDRWTLLIVRDLLLGATRFKDFATGPERIPTNVLTDRLTRLEEWQIVEKVPVAPKAVRMKYELTAKGQTLAPLVKSIAQWGLEHVPGTAADRKI